MVGIQFLDDCAKRELDMMMLSEWDHMIWGLDQSYLLLAGPIIGSATPARCLTGQDDLVVNRYRGIYRGVIMSVTPL